MKHSVNATDSRYGGSDGVALVWTSGVDGGIRNCGCCKAVGDVWALVMGQQPTADGAAPYHAALPND